MRNREGKLIIFGILILITISVVIVDIYWIDNIPTMEEYKEEYDRLCEECMEDAPEGSICIVDYFPPNLAKPILLGLSIIPLWIGFIELIRRKEVKNN